MRDDLPDVAVGALAVTHPLWLDLLNAAAQEVMLIGGAALVLHRVYLWLKGKKEAEE